MSKIERKNLMSIREFIESGGNMNINTHANSQLLEEEFAKGLEGKYKNEEMSNFQVEYLIGKGRYANIYLAKYQGESVVLKVFDKVNLYKNSLIERVELERNILCAFDDNKFLCHMKFYFSTKTKIVFVLPYFRGGDLFTFLLNRKFLRETQAAFYVVQIVHMISFLHSKNILYRDLKLENIMFNENGYLTLIDFGSCKVIEDEKELESSFIGSADYISPEIINGEGHNKMSDWWSFGVILYELLHGVTPFHDEKMERIFDLITASKIRFNSKIILTPETKDLILRLLKKNPNERMGKGEYDEIIAHPFFKSVNPKNIIIQKTSPPQKPEIDDNNPVKNFDDMYLGMEIENFDEAADISLLNKISNLFESFEK
jgi:serum/glucocorticoid-regulated kinase 2